MAVKNDYIDKQGTKGFGLHENKFMTVFYNC